MIDIEVEDDVWSADVPDVEGVVARAAEQVAPSGDVVILLTDDEAEAMEAQERMLLAALGIPDPYLSRNDT